MVFPAVEPGRIMMGVPRKLPPSPDEKPQRERFIEGARELGASEDPEDFERVFRQIMKPTKASIPEPETKRDAP